MAKRAPRRVRVTVPATTSNLGPGFDVLGMALNLRNELVVEALPKGAKDVVDIRGEGEDRLPAGPSNLVVRAFRKGIKKKGGAYRFRMLNRIPLSRGLGSSAAARLSGLLAGEAFSGSKPDFARIVRTAAAMEGHPDNVVPAFFGGLAGSAVDNGEIRTFHLRPPKELSIALLVPDMEVSTQRARRALPKTVPLATAVKTASRLAMLVAAFEQKSFLKLRAAMQDVLHQPHRAKLIPGFYAAVRAAEKAGALGAALSGSGPTVLAFALGDAAARRAARAMAESFALRGKSGRVLFAKVDAAGARLSVR